LGIAFENGDIGREIFSEWVTVLGHVDQFEVIRVSIIEGNLPGPRPGYAVHVSPDPVGVAAWATSEGIVLDPIFVSLGRVDVMYPLPDSPSGLPQFKELYRRHNEFLLAPVSRREDGRLWVEMEFGIVKTAIQFRELSEIREDDLDAFALHLPVR
jgi:hypothetical protein